MTLIQKILAGQAKLDEMKADTQTLVRKCASAVKKHAPDENKIRFKSDNGVWEIIPVMAATLGEPNGEPLICYSEQYARFMYRYGDVKHGNPYDVIATHRALNALVEGILNRYPIVRDEVDMLLKALEVA